MSIIIIIITIIIIINNRISHPAIIYSWLAAVKQNLGGHKFKGNYEVETRQTMFDNMDTDCMDRE